MTKKINKPLIFIMSIVLALSTIAGVVGATWAMTNDPYTFTATAPTGNYGSRILTYGTSTASTTVTISGVRNATSSNSNKLSASFVKSTGVITMTAKAEPGIASVLVGSRGGVIAAFECLTKNNTSYIETCKFAKRYEEIKSGATFTMASKLQDVSATQIATITWTSLDPAVATVSNGTVTGKSKGIVELDGAFKDCYGQAQKIVFTVAVDCKINGGDTVKITRPISEVPGATTGDILRPVGTPANVYEVVDENGKSHYPPAYVYDQDKNGNPNDGTLVPVVSGTDGYYVESPTNVFNKIDTSGNQTTDAPKWGGEDGKLGTPDDENAKKFGDKYYADMGQNVFAPIQGTGNKELGALIGGGTNGDPTTGNAQPIVEIDGKYYLAEQTDGSGDGCLYGDKTSGGNGALNSEDGKLDGSDQIFYFNPTTGKPTTTKPTAGVDIPGTTANPTTANWTGAALAAGAIGAKPALTVMPTIKDYDGNAVAPSRITYTYVPDTYATSGQVPVAVVMNVDGKPVSAASITATVAAPATGVNASTLSIGAAALDDGLVGYSPSMKTYPSLKYNNGTAVPDSEMYFTYNPVKYTAAGAISVVATVYVAGVKIGTLNLSATVTDPSTPTTPSTDPASGLPVTELVSRDFVTNKIIFIVGNYAYRILKTDGMGNYLIITTDVKNGDVLYYTKDSNYTTPVTYTGTVTYSAFVAELRNSSTTYDGSAVDKYLSDPDEGSYFNQLQNMPANANLFASMCTVVVPQESDSYVSTSETAKKRAFVLSQSEAEGCFSGNADRIVKTGTSGYYWLRSVSKVNSSYIGLVDKATGKIYTPGAAPNSLFAVRPAMWIRINTGA